MADAWVEVAELKRRLDVAVIRDMDLEGFSTFDHVPNDQLLTFGEAKHMSAFAELVASFIGVVS